MKGALLLTTLFSLVFLAAGHAELPTAAARMAALEEEHLTRRSQSTCEELNGNTVDSTRIFGATTIDGSKCFFLVEPTGTRYEYWFSNWERSESELCKFHGGHLASVVSPAEHEAAKELYQREIWNGQRINGVFRGLWIGLSDRDQDGTWEWNDGSPSWSVGSGVFSKWISGGRNYEGKNPGCVAMVGGTGEWKAKDCEIRAPMLCAKQLDP